MQRRWAYGLVGLGVAIAVPLIGWGRHQLASQTSQQSAIAGLSSDATETAPKSLTPADEAAIADVIRQQMAAFQADDAQLAFSLASPSIQAQFQTADQFMAMVQTTYAPVYRPQSVDFGPVEVMPRGPVQMVTVLAPGGSWVAAYYQMEQQPDATWRIAGCVLRPVAGSTI